ncbi:MAG: hypothetical protein JWP97_2885 [Labilithrix sp.]|nr:hypothetical protein [Labilithrix sp.]
MFDLNRRAAGTLLHLTSLPGPHGSGDMGAGAYAFADFLEAAGCGWWQMLPVSLVGAGYSPYAGRSAFAGNPLLIDLDALAKRGLLDLAALPEVVEGPGGRIDYAAVTERREAALRLAIDRAIATDAVPEDALAEFRERTAAWLGDYALFMALGRREGGKPWTEWPAPLAKRRPEALARAREELRGEILHFELEQFFFDEQWQALRAYCAKKKIGLIGDVPIFVAHDSADVWAHQRFFRLDAKGDPTHVAGVPPDYFSKTGQRWGNPLYRWKRLRRDGYTWWLQRFSSLLTRFDVVRLDHFIGFVRYWEIPASEPTAENGRYVKGPGADLFEQAERALGKVPFIAEDLGTVTPAVRHLRQRFRLPGMRVLQFAFGTDVQAKAFLPHAFVRRTVAYTGTHDNDTFVGWLEDEGGEGNPRSKEQAQKERGEAADYLTGASDAAPTEITAEAIRALYASVASTVIIPLQDVLGLDNQARMNVPGAADDNWAWRFRDDELTPERSATLRDLARRYGRLPS